MTRNQARRPALSPFTHPRTRGLMLAAAAGVGAAVLGGAPAAHATPSAAARLAGVAHHAPKRQVVAIVQFDASTSEAQAQTLGHRHGARGRGGLPLLHGVAPR